MLTAAWFPLRFHAQQSALWRCPARFVSVVAGRGSGKTEIARRRVVRYLAVSKKWSDPVYFYALPVREQAKRVAWPKLKQLMPAGWIKNVNETELKIETVFGSTLYVFGMDKPHRAEGLQYDGGVIDESSDQKPGVFNITFLPALSHRGGWCWRIGAPKRYGVGAKDFKQFYYKGLKGECLNDDPNMRIQSFNWASSDIVDPSVIAFARATLDQRDFNEQYGGRWEQSGGRVYYAYDDELNVAPVQYNSQLPIVIGSDFNVSPMSWVIGHRYPNGLHIFDELFMRDVSTGDALNELFRRYGNHENGFEFFGDATGKARKTAASSAAQSDYIVINNDGRFKKKRLFYPPSNPPISDRYASVNALCCNAGNERRLMVDPKCKNLRSDLENMVYLEGTREPDERNKDTGHITDALGYIIHRVFPLRAIQESKPAIHSFAPSVI